MKKLALDAKNPNFNENLLLDARAGLLKFGSLSVCYLMRKLKVTEDMAKKIIRHLETEDLQHKINYQTINVNK